MESRKCTGSSDCVAIIGVNFVTAAINDKSWNHYKEFHQFNQLGTECAENISFFLDKTVLNDNSKVSQSNK